MIVRILGEGQWRIDAESLPGLNDLDDRVAGALEADDQQALEGALTLLLEQIRAGEKVPDEELAESDLIVPDASASLDEVRAFLDESGSTEGLIPG
ncbi:PspA-associated protein PspAA [Luteococcus sp. Sow4_B9]|uniref:PspA-associated protein PspAA n=1 Tax=Luteococcus sp. Sow4_B9 TaxID=3438792 RepID=UPI003F9C75BC